MSSPKHTFPILLLTIFVAAFLYLGSERPSDAQGLSGDSSDNVWTGVPEGAFEIDALNLKPLAYQVLNLNTAKLNEILRTAPLRFTANESRVVILTLPLPTGGFGRFQIEESPIIAAKLAERFPWLKSYSAKGLDDRTASARFEITPEGLTAMVTSASGTFFIDPASKSDSRRYISYFKKDLPRDPSDFLCYANKPPPPIKPRTLPEPKKKLHHALPAAGDSDFRIYRLAVAASSEYVKAIHQSSISGPGGDPLSQAIIAIHRTIDRVNQIYERELGVSLELVGDEESIIYLNPVNDPYATPTNLNGFLDANEKNLDDVLGWDNYDVGHLFLAHGGGVASEPCACNYWYKADGLTGRANPQGDAFDVDYVAHELGHQFGASHSFNGTTNGCKFRNADTAYEPGSGSTIMGYASSPAICGAENVQDHSDDYFHAASLREINLFITNTNPQMGDSCSLKLATNNFSRPLVVGPGDFVIPKGTPFTLTIKSGLDNDGDPLEYNWEEFDLGDPDPPKLGDPLEPEKVRPLFRSRQWPGSSRTFPQLADLLDPPPAGTYTAESLPMNNRTMIFRATVRDSRGRYGYEDSQIRVIAFRRLPGGKATSGSGVTVLQVGPFIVTRPAQAESWLKWTRHTVKWDVANTNLAPIACNFVKISLLRRGDESHPIQLVAKTPNDGSATVIVPPNFPLGRARVKVEAWDNIFFNLAKADVLIVKRP